MATTAKNNIKRSEGLYSVIESISNFISSAISYNQGDLLYLDTTAHLIKPIAADGNTATFLGVARQTVVSGVFKSPYVTAVDAAQGPTDGAGPAAGVTIEVVLNTADAFNPGDKVYPIGSVDAQTVSSSSNTGARKACGVYVGPAVASATAGQKGLVHIESQYPVVY